MDRAGLLSGVTSLLVGIAGLLGAVTLIVAVLVAPSALTVGLGVVALVFVAVPIVGAAIARTDPANALGWLLLAAGVHVPVAIGAYVLSRTGAIWAGWLDGWPWVPATVLVPTVGLLLVPDGSLPSRRWRPVLWLDVVVAAALVVWLAGGTTLLDYPAIANPTALPGTAGAVADSFGAAIALVAPLTTVSAWAVHRRWRSATDPDTRRALGLVMPAAWAVAASWWSCWVIVAVTGNSLYAAPAEAMGMVALAVAGWVAIRRFGLFDVRVVLTGTLVYGALTLCVIGLYLGVGAAVDTVLGAAAGPLAVAVALLVALPLRDLLQRAATRLVYGYRDDPYGALVHLGGRLEDAAAPEDVLPAVTRIVRGALRLPYVAVVIGEDPVAESGRPLGARREAFALVFAGESLGELVVEPRDDRPLSVADHRTLTGVAGQVAAAGHAVRLTAALVRSRERLVAATEEERRRLRRDLHDGIGPTLASLVLGLHRARGRVPEEPRAALAQLDALTEQVQGAVAEVRRLVWGLRPPALDELGVVGALDEQARALGATVHGPADAELSAAAEVATYRIALEAMTNAARHARAPHCEVRIRVEQREVLVEVDDDGVGLPAGFRAGVGIASMRERAAELGGRCVVEPRTPQGTAVRAAIPRGL